MDLFMPNKTGFEATEAIRLWEEDLGVSIFINLNLKRHAFTLGVIPH